MEKGEKVFAVKFGKDCPCGKPDCPVRDVLKNLMERVAVQQDLEKQAAEEIKNLNDLVEKQYPDKPPSLIDVVTFLRGIEAAREQKKEKENPAEQQPAENQDEPPPLVEYDLHIPSLERVAAVRVRASEREVAKAIFRAAGEGANKLKIKTKYVDASVRIKLKEEGYIVRDDGIIGWRSDGEINIVLEMEGEVTVKDVPQMRGEGRWRLPVPSRIADLEEEIKELKEENADLKVRIAKCEALLFKTCVKGHCTPRSNPWCVECGKGDKKEEQKVGFEKQLIDGRWVW